MKKRILSPLFFFFSIIVLAQMEKYPVFPGCEDTPSDSLEICFKKLLTAEVIKNFNTPEEVIADNFKGEVSVVFYVSKEGALEVLHINSPYKSVETEAKRVFSELPKVTPAKYNNQDIDMHFVLPLNFPLGENTAQVPESKKAAVAANYAVEQQNEEDWIKPDSLELLEHHSTLNVPYTHQQYAVLDYYYNLADNSHTASKPFIYSEVENYVDLDAKKSDLMQKRTTWFGRKFWNEHMVQVQGKKYWFTIDPIVDLQIGKDNSDEVDFTYNNTRGIQIQGAIGKKFSFYTTFFESQGRFANYVNEYAEALKPSGGNPAIIPGRGIAKDFKEDGYDYPVAEAYMSFSPSKVFNFQFGHGKNFIGDGYRSLLLSNNASPSPFFKINTTFWKIKYTNNWMWLRDVRPEVTEDGVFKPKYMATHYLSWNVSKRLNIGLFESVIWEDSNGRGFDINYLNPIIFYRAIEFSTGSRGGNAIIGLSGKYKFSDRVSVYTQLMIDEFTTGEIAKGDGYWGNKNGFQVGLKYHHAFGVENLHLQGEYNSVRPFTYSHNTPLLNYGHSNQSMAHQWGANFWEVSTIAHYEYQRWYGNAKLIFGTKGFDIEGDPTNYGGNIYRDYDERNGDYGHEIGQGNTTNRFIGDLQVGYLLNPATNLKLFGNFTYRSFQPEMTSETFDSDNTIWFSLGMRTDLFDWNFEF